MGGRKIENTIERYWENIYEHEYDYQGKLPHVGVVVFGQEYSYTTKGIEIIKPVSSNFGTKYLNVNENFELCRGRGEIVE